MVMKSGCGDGNSLKMDTEEDVVGVETKETKIDVEAYVRGKRNNNINYDETLKAAAKFNKKMNEEKKARRAAYFDMQTFTCHYPMTNKGRMRVVKEPAPGHYPLPTLDLSLPKKPDPSVLEQFISPGALVPESSVLKVGKIIFCLPKGSKLIEKIFTLFLKI